MQHVISVAMGKNAPSMIPTSGERATANDFYVVYLLDSEGTARFLVNEISDTELRGKWSLDGRNFTEPKALSTSELSGFTVWIQHYYRAWTFYSIGVLKFLLYRWTNWPWLRVKFDRLLQARYNRQELPRQDRMKVLSYMMSETIKDRTFQTHPTNLLTHFYTVRWVHRPDKEELMTYYTYLLDSLKVSEDVVATEHHGYKLMPKALNTITGFDLEEQRHNDNKKIQTGLFWLTIVLMVVGVVQAGAAAYEQWWKPPETFTGTIGNVPITLQQQ
ncbi:hypothetical protein [Agrobacterium pusense]|uniref:hypothetical protein n=1 Tax=Agrobacterium pusense TaxID=648995 RepID=UPI000D3AC178|nr:hypothetical protein [Agrobacterium pusense]PTV70262.1 hypothetical protein DBL06_25715 [Agrobacterium pusense]